MSGIQAHSHSAMPFARTSGDAFVKDDLPRSDAATERDEARRARAPRRFELAAFPAVFLTLLGAPAEAEVPLPAPAVPVAVPSAAEGETEYDLGRLAEVAHGLGGLLEGEGWEAAAARMASLGDRIQAAARGEGDDPTDDLIRELEAGLVDFAEVVDLSQLIVGAVRTLDPPAADTLEGWGFNPEFRDRLARVVERMRGEFGLEVEVIEGFREQSRQNDLWSQGRSRPGPVVTWTKESRHTVGAAADLKIDGGFVKGTSALLLSRIAAEEGLRTLGPKDPGHIELAGDMARLASEADDLGLAKELRERFRPVETGTPARDLRRGASGVARVAPVARVARPARPGGELPAPTPAPAPDPASSLLSALDDGLLESAPRAAPEPDEFVSRALAAGLAGAEAEAERRGSREPRGDSKSAEPQSGVRADGSDIRMGVASDRLLEGWARRVGGGVPGLDMIRRIQAVEAAQPISPLRRVLIGLEGPDATELGSVRLDVRGARVDALFEIDDASLARRIERDLATLRTQLAAEGVDPGRLRVRTGPGVDGGLVGAELRTEARVMAGAEASRQRGGEGQGQAQDQTPRGQRDPAENRRGLREDTSSRGHPEPEEEA